MKTVKLFIECLEKQNFRTAYNLQNTNNWRTFNNFISKNAFRGITNTKINTINAESDETSNSVILINASYPDPTKNST